jgi:hypothetical protein
MESWEGDDINKYTRNNTGWTRLMNLSTADWNLGPFPPNVIAIPGKYNDSYNYPDDTIYIENAGNGKVGHRDTEKIIFGVTSAVVVIIMIVWIGFQKKHGLLKPNDRTSPMAPRTRRSPMMAGGSSGSITVAENGFMGDEAFRDRLRYYYDEIETHEELAEKDPYNDPIDGEDIENVTDLLRKMYDTDLAMWALSSAHGVSEESRGDMRVKSDAILAEVRRTVGEWETQSRRRWEREEGDQWRTIRNILSGLPEKRYAN